ncbi:MAG TPA: hypothetical protein VF490_06390 [Chryseosolibacter sp.]
MKEILSTDRGSESTGRKQKSESQEARFEGGAFRIVALSGVSTTQSTNVKDQK